MQKKIHKLLFLGLTTTSLSLPNLTSCNRSFSVIVNNYDLPEIASCKNKDVANYNVEYALEIKFKQGYTLDLNKYSVMCISDDITEKCIYDANICELTIPKQFVIGFIIINIAVCERIINLTWNVDYSLNIDKNQTPSSIKYLDYLERNFVIHLRLVKANQLTWSILDAKYKSKLGWNEDKETSSWLKELDSGIELVIPYDYLKWDLIINITKK